MKSDIEEQKPKKLPTTMIGDNGEWGALRTKVEDPYERLMRLRRIMEEMYTEDLKEEKRKRDEAEENKRAETK